MKFDKIDASKVDVEKLKKSFEKKSKVINDKTPVIK